MNATVTVPIQSNLLDLLMRTGLGEPAAIVPMALRQYIVDRYLQRIEIAEKAIAVCSGRYGTNYETFSQRVTTDQAYFDTINREHPL